MQDSSQTTRERLAEYLRSHAETPSELATEFDISRTQTLDHLEHVAQSLSNADETLEVASPQCRTCGFSDFDHLLNVPSRCPECKSENIAEPIVRIA